MWKSKDEAGPTLPQLYTNRMKALAVAVGAPFSVLVEREQEGGEGRDLKNDEDQVKGKRQYRAHSITCECGNSEKFSGRIHTGNIPCLRLGKVQSARFCERTDVQRFRHVKPPISSSPGDCDWAIKTRLVTVATSPVGKEGAFNTPLCHDTKTGFMPVICKSPPEGEPVAALEKGMVLADLQAVQEPLQVPCLQRPDKGKRGDRGEGPLASPLDPDEVVRPGVVGECKLKHCVSGVAQPEDIMSQNFHLASSPKAKSACRTVGVSGSPVNFREKIGSATDPRGPEAPPHRHQKNVVVFRPILHTAAVRVGGLLWTDDSEAERGRGDAKKIVTDETSLQSLDAVMHFKNLPDTGLNVASLATGALEELTPSRQVVCGATSEKIEETEQQQQAGGASCGKSAVLDNFLGEANNNCSNMHNHRVALHDASPKQVLETDCCSVSSINPTHIIPSLECTTEKVEEGAKCSRPKELKRTVMKLGDGIVQVHSPLSFTTCSEGSLRFSRNTRFADSANEDDNGLLAVNYVNEVAPKDLPSLIGTSVTNSIESSWGAPAEHCLSNARAGLPPAEVGGTGAVCVHDTVHVTVNCEPLPSPEDSLKRPDGSDLILSLLPDKAPPVLPGALSEFEPYSSRTFSSSSSNTTTTTNGLLLQQLKGKMGLYGKDLQLPMFCSDH
ncbi:hypothetical protein ERJ75_001760000 [Trypanosoma vivax]|uniref:Uncharacterized protein n=1 Tax=Trypanosoma vivax (strain Y486) TaxID=1055687 RepID=G0TWA1_TRYVY|nr:hypothetical protein TRVL_07661 [Trypanosoma vivax]KAH8604060.1 hypothetical protein ERJ75_001760000 [Trypanosoma vivax]CCC48239.1 hypothetical protein TVY486_0600300 [Trypanosoma vivax Y486]